MAAERERLIELACGDGGVNLEQLQQSLQQTVWGKAGVIRNRLSLEDGHREIVTLREQLEAVSLTDSRQLPQLIKLANMLTVSEMVCRATLTRTESRGAHYRIDYPEEDEKWLKVIEINRRSGQMTLDVIPVNGEREYHKLD